MELTRFLEDMALGLGIKYVLESHMCDDLLRHSYLNVMHVPRMTVQVASNTCHVCKLFLSIIDEYARGRKLERIEVVIDKGVDHYDRFFVSGEKGGLLHQSASFYIFTPSGIIQSRISP